MHKNKKTLWKSTLEFAYESNSSDNVLSLKQKLKKLSIKKRNADPCYMCENIPNSEELIELYNYVMDLGYDEEPNYDYILQL